MTVNNIVNNGGAAPAVTVTPIPARSPLVPPFGFAMRFYYATGRSPLDPLCLLMWHQASEAAINRRLLLSPTF